MSATMVEYLNQGIALCKLQLSSYLSNYTHCTSVVGPPNSITLCVSGYKQFRKTYRAMFGVIDDHLIQFSTGSNNHQDGYRVHVLNFHLP